MDNGAAIRAAAARRGASSIALAGSVARRADREDSDCDFVCEFAEGTTLVDVAGLRLDLIKMLGCEVDISVARMLDRPYDSMLEDAIPL